MDATERQRLEEEIASCIANFEMMRNEIKGACCGFNELFPDDSALETASDDSQRSLARLQAIITSRLDGMLTR